MKVSELIGPELEYWVCKTLGYQRVRIQNKPHFCIASSHGSSVDLVWQFSTDWSQGGPIIEREKINISFDSETDCIAYMMWGPPMTERGPTPLIAAMRAFVASKYGEEVNDQNG